MNKFKTIIWVILMAISINAVYIVFVSRNGKIVNADNANIMRSNGKLYVVVAIVVTILLGLFLYVFNLDRKISKLEKK